MSQQTDQAIPALALESDVAGVEGPKAVPGRTCALVVAIEKYDVARPIPGPADAADQFCCWLRRRGVPPDQIARLTSRISPGPSPAGCLAPGAADPDGTGRPDLPPDGATPTHDQVWRLLNRTLIAIEEQILGPVGSGINPDAPVDELLIIYWSGHGLLDSRGARRVFFENTTPQDWLLLQLPELLDYLKSSSVRFRNQIVILDACANWGPAQKEFVLPDCDLPRRLGPDDYQSDKSQFVLLSVEAGRVALFPNGKSAFFEALFPELDKAPQGCWPPPMKRIALVVQDKCRARAGLAQSSIPIFSQDWSGNRFTTTAALDMATKIMDEAYWKPALLLPAATRVWLDIGKPSLLPGWLNLAYLQLYVWLGRVQPVPLERRMLAAAWRHQARLLIAPTAFLAAVAVAVWWVVFATQARDIVAKLTRPGMTAGQIPAIVTGDYRGRLPFLRSWMAGRIDAAALDLKDNLFDAATSEHQVSPTSAHRNAAMLALAAASVAGRPPAREFLDSGRPTTRQYLIEGMPEVFPAATLVGWLAESQAAGDADLTCALALALDGYGAAELSSCVVGDKPLVRWLLDCYTNDHDPGVHSTVGWLLRVKLDCVGLTPVPAVDAGEASPPTAGDRRRWCVTRERVWMACFPAMTQFKMGIYQPGNSQNDAPRHCRQIDRAFALGITEVTNLEFGSCTDIKDRPNDPQSRRPDQPATFVSWDDAARYCNWLNRRANPPLQDCYEEQKPLSIGRPARMIPVAGALSKTGYRLPTEAEWEYGCRAGTESYFYFGIDSRLLAFNALIKRGETSPVGRFRPNSFGLHDTYSNVTEWCHDPTGQYQPRIDGCDQDDHNLGVKLAYQARGGNPNSPDLANSFAREDIRYSNRLPYHGFRLARTLFLADSVPVSGQ